MSIPITLSNGQTIVIDETTGDIIQDSGPVDQNQREGERSRTSTLGLPEAPSGAQAGFNPDTDRVIDVVNLPGGKQIEYQSATGGVQRVFVPDSTGGGGGVSATSIYSQQQANARDQAALAQNQAQFDQQMGYDKARFNTQISGRDALGNPTLDARQFDQNLAQRQYEFGQNAALDREKTALSLGSRPETLQRYLRALRGEFSPQGLGLPAPQMPLGPLPGGAQQVAAGQPAPALGQAAPTSVPGASTGGGLSGFGDTPGTYRVSPTDPDAAKMLQKPGYQLTSPTAAAPYLQQLAKEGNSTQTYVPGYGTGTGSGISSAPVAGAPVGANTQSAQDALIAGGRKPKFYSGGVAIFKHGGPIPEHVIGVGLKSGKTYEFGEAGSEFVIPNNKVKDLMSLLGKGMMDDEGMDMDGEQDMMGNKSYQTGGQIGYDPTSLFNPAPGLVNQANIGGLPQVDYFTGGGQSLLPSAQKLSNSLGSERDFYGGFLQDEAGINPNDVFELAGKMAPKVRGLTTPRYV